MKGTVRAGEEAAAIARLNAQLRFLIAPSQEQAIAPEEVNYQSDFARVVPPTSGAVGETDRASGITPEEAAIRYTGGTAFDRNADPALARDFDEHGVNRSFGSTDMGAENAGNRPLSSREIEQMLKGQGTQIIPVAALDLYHELRPWFREGELEPILFDVAFNTPGFEEVSREVQQYAFLKQIFSEHYKQTSPNLLLPVNSGDESIPVSVELWINYIKRRQFRNSQGLTNDEARGPLPLEFSQAFFGEELGEDVVIQVADVLGFLTSPLIPEHLVENIEGPWGTILRGLVQSTSPLEIAMLFIPGGGLGAGKIASRLISAAVGNVFAQAAHEGGYGQETQFVVGLIGGEFAEGALKLAKDVPGAAADAASRSLSAGDVTLNFARQSVSGLLDTARSSSDIGERAYAEVLAAIGRLRKAIPEFDDIGESILKKAGDGLDKLEDVPEDAVEGIAEGISSLGESSFRKLKDSEELLKNVLTLDKLKEKDGYVGMVKVILPYVADRETRDFLIQSSRQLVEDAARSGLSYLQAEKTEIAVSAIANTIEQVSDYFGRAVNTAMPEYAALPLGQFIEPDVRDSLVLRVRRGIDLEPSEKALAERGLNKLFAGAVPSEQEMSLLTRTFGESFGASIDTATRSGVLATLER